MASLDWSDRSCYADFQPPYDFILAADCVYSELAGEPHAAPYAWSGFSSAYLPPAPEAAVAGPSIAMSPGALLPGLMVLPHRRASPCPEVRCCWLAPGVARAVQCWNLLTSCPAAMPHPAPSAVPHLLATVLAMGGPRTSTIITNEFRSQARLLGVPAAVQSATARHAGGNVMLCGWACSWLCDSLVISRLTLLVISLLSHADCAR